MDNLETSNLDVKENSVADNDIINISNLNIEEPHWILKYDEISELIKISKQLGGASSRDMVSKSFYMKFEDGKIKVILTDAEIYVVKMIDILNTSNVISNMIILSTEAFGQILNLSSKYVIIKQVNFKYFICFNDGEVPLELFICPMEKYKIPVTENEVCKLSADKLLFSVKQLVPIVNAAIQPQEKRLLFSSDGVYSVISNSIVKVPLQASVFDLRIKDMSILKTLLANVEGDLVLKNNVKNSRFTIQGSNFEYSFLGSDVKIPQRLVDNFASVLQYPSLKISSDRLYKLSELSSVLSYSVGKLGLQFNGSDLIVKFKTRNASNCIDKEFVLKGVANTEIPTFKGELEIKSETLKLLLKVFAGSSQIDISLFDGGISLKSINVYSVSYLNVSAIKRAETPMKLSAGSN